MAPSITCPWPGRTARPPVARSGRAPPSGGSTPERRAADPRDPYPGAARPNRLRLGFAPAAASAGMCEDNHPQHLDPPSRPRAKPQVEEQVRYGCRSKRPICKALDERIRGVRPVAAETRDLERRIRRSSTLHHVVEGPSYPELDLPRCVSAAGRRLRSCLRIRYSRSDRPPAQIFRSLEDAAHLENPAAWSIRCPSVRSERAGLKSS